MYTSCHTGTEDGHSCENGRGHCAWTRTLQWMLRHAAGAHNRFQPQSHRGGTLWEGRKGTCCRSPLLPFMEACMIRVPMDPPSLRRKLDVQWMKGIWVRRLDESAGHVVLTPHGTVTGRSVRRLAGNLRVQPRVQTQLCLRPNF